jgi:hypothetical protein
MARIGIEQGATHFLLVPYSPSRTEVRRWCVPRSWWESGRNSAWERKSASTSLS